MSAIQHMPHTAGRRTTLRDLPGPDPVTVDADTSLRLAASLMRETGAHEVLVVEDGRLRGVVTARDIALRGVAEGLDPLRTAVGAVCTRDVVTAAPHDDVVTAVRLMRENGLSCLPVAWEHHPVGMVGLADAEAALSGGTHMPGAHPVIRGRPTV